MKPRKPQPVGASTPEKQPQQLDFNHGKNPPPAVKTLDENPDECAACGWKPKDDDHYIDLERVRGGIVLYAECLDCHARIAQRFISNAELSAMQSEHNPS